MTPPLPPCLRRHPLHRLARAQNAAGDVDRHHALDALGRHVLDPHAAFADNAPIVDERAERAELVGGLEQFEDITSLRRHRISPRSPCRSALNRGDHFLAPRPCCWHSRRRPETARRGGDGGGAADAAATAGDDGYFVGHTRPNALLTRRIKYDAGDSLLSNEPSMGFQPLPAALSRHRSSTSRAGSSRLSLTRTRNVTASLPSMTR